MRRIFPKAPRSRTQHPHAFPLVHASHISIVPTSLVLTFGSFSWPLQNSSARVLEGHTRLTSDVPRFANTLHHSGLRLDYILLLHRTSPYYGYRSSYSTRLLPESRKAGNERNKAPPRIRYYSLHGSSRIISPVNSMPSSSALMNATFVLVRSVRTTKISLGAQKKRGKSFLEARDIVLVSCRIYSLKKKEEYS